MNKKKEPEPKKGQQSKKKYERSVSPFDLLKAFKALGEPTRLEIYDYLRSCCSGSSGATEVAVEANGDICRIDGPTMGQICCHVTGAEQITSNVFRHLKELSDAGLITIEKRGKQRICNVNSDAIAAMAAYFHGQGQDGMRGTSQATNSGNGGACC